MQPLLSMDSTFSQWEEVQTHFGLNQAALGRLLGLSKAMMYQVATGRRSLPASAQRTWARLVLALPAASAPPPTPPAPDLAALAWHAQACVARAAQLAVALADAQARAAAAMRRLAALPQLAAPLLPTEAPAAPPAWLVQFESEARVTLATYGPLAQARLVMRRASLLGEATAVEQLLSGDKIYNLADEGSASTFSRIFNPLQTVPHMAFSVSRFTTKAQCQAYLDKKAPERLLLIAHQGNVQAVLATWDADGDPAADLVSAQNFADSLAIKLAATTDPREKLRTERLLNSERTRITNLGGRTVNHGVDELLDREQDRDDTASALATLDRLIADVTTQRDALPA